MSSARSLALAPPRPFGVGKTRKLTSPPLGWALPLLILAAWQVESMALLVPASLLPTPTQVIGAFGVLLRTGELWRDSAVTLLRVAIGFTIGGLLATVLGCLTGTSRSMQRLLDPLVQGLRSVPSIAWVPLFILWLGIAEGSKIALIAVGAFFPVYLNLMGAIAGVDRRLVDVARVHGLGGFGVLRYVLLPASMPAYLIGLRGGLGLAWMFVAAAELLGASQGLGFLLSDGEETGRPETVIAAIILFAILGRLTDRLLAVGARRVLVRGAT